MGYYTQVEGEITITPPLTWAEVQSQSATIDALEDVRVDIAEETVDTDYGYEVRRTASTITPAYEDSYKAYRLMSDTQRVVDAFPGHTFTGQFECYGEEAGDLWRVVIRDGQVTKVEPRIVWPDEA